MNWWEKWLKLTFYASMTVLVVIAWILMFVVISYLGIFIYESIT